MGDEHRWLRRTHPDDRQAAVLLIDAEPAPLGGVEHLAHEPADHEVVSDQEVVAVSARRREELAGRVGHLRAAGVDLLLAHTAEEGLERLGHVGGRTARVAVEEQGIRLDRGAAEPRLDDAGSFSGTLQGGMPGAGEGNLGEPVPDGRSLQLALL